MPENFAEQHRNISFSNNVEMSLRQRSGLLSALVGSTASYKGVKSSRITNRFGRVTMQERATRNGDTRTSDIDSLARWIRSAKASDVALLIDPDDVDVTEVDLGSPLVEAVADAARVYHDDMWSRGFFGNGYTGEAGEIAVPFKAANIIPHGGAGLTKNKLLALRELILTRHVSMQLEKPIIILQPQDETDLFQIEEYTNTRYGEGTPLADGELKPWLGFRFFSYTADSESLPTSYASWTTDAGATRQLPVVVPSGLHRGVWNEFKGRMGERADKSYAEQVFGEARSAVVRTEEDKAFILQTQ